MTGRLPQGDEAGGVDPLAARLTGAWTMLADGAANRRGGAHLTQVATNRPGAAPGLRTVVLRAADPARRLLRFHTDARAPKVAEIRADPAVSLHVYDPQARTQLRLEGAAEAVLNGPEHAAAWAATQPMSRVCYQMTTPYGARLSTPDGVAYDAAATDEGVRNFAVILIRVQRFERLDLSHAGNIRSAHDWDGADWAGRWLAP